MSNGRRSRFRFPSENTDSSTHSVEDHLVRKMQKQDEVSAIPTFPVQQEQTKPQPSLYQYGEYEQPVQPQPSRSTTEVFNPRVFEDAHVIANHIVARVDTIVNFEAMLKDSNKKNDALRIIDYLAGVAFASKVKTMHINDYTFLYTSK